MPKVYSYVRFSTPAQAEGDSLRRQTAAARRWAEEHGYEFDDRLTIADKGLSAYKGVHLDQGGLGVFLAAAQAEKVERGSVLVVEGYDRLSRAKPMVAMGLLTDLLDAGIEIVTLSPPQHMTPDMDPMTMMVAVMEFGRGHSESQRKSERLGAAWAEKKRQAATGKPQTSRCPAWLRLKENRKAFEVDGDKAKVIEGIFKAASEGIGAATIARRLTADGVETFGRSDGWQPSYIKKILKNEAVIGVYQPMKHTPDGRVPDGPPVEGYYPAVIDEGLFHETAKVIAERRLGGGRRGKTFSNIFRGLAVCGVCDRPMHYVNKGEPPKGGRYLVCDGGHRRLCDHKRHHRYDDIEAAVLSGVAELDFSTIVSDRDAVADARAELTTLSAKSAAITNKRRRLLEILGEAEDDDLLGDQYNKLKAEQDATKVALKAAKAALRRAEAGADDMQRNADKLGKLAAMLDGADDSERFRLRAAMHQVLCNIVQRIEIPPNGAWTLTLRDGSFTTYVMMPDGLVRVPHAVLESVDEMFEGVPDDETLEGY